jgi:hypothetical protein
MVSDKSKEPLVGIVIRNFEEFTGTVVAVESRLMRIVVDTGSEKIELTLKAYRGKPEFKVTPDDLDDKKKREEEPLDLSPQGIEVIKNAKDMGIDMPYKIAILAGKKVKVTPYQVEVLE